MQRYLLVNFSSDRRFLSPSALIALCRAWSIANFHWSATQNILRDYLQDDGGILCPVDLIYILRYHLRETGEWSRAAARNKSDEGLTDGYSYICSIFGRRSDRVYQYPSVNFSSDRRLFSRWQRLLPEVNKRVLCHTWRRFLVNITIKEHTHCACGGKGRDALIQHSILRTMTKHWKINRTTDRSTDLFRNFSPNFHTRTIQVWKELQTFHYRLAHVVIITKVYPKPMHIQSIACNA